MKMNSFLPFPAGVLLWFSFLLERKHSADLGFMIMILKKIGIYFHLTPENHSHEVE